MLTRPSFKKSLIVEQFQGNYLKRFCYIHRNWFFIQTVEQCKYITMDKAKMDRENYNLNLLVDLHENLESNARKNYC